MRLRKATESEYALYARWRDIVFSIPFSGTRPTDEVLQARRLRRHLYKPKSTDGLTLRERQRINRHMELRRMRKKLKYSMDQYKGKVDRKEITFIEEEGVVIGYVEIRLTQKFFRIVDWALSGRYQEFDYMEKVLDQLKKKAGKREIFILAPKIEGEWSCEALTTLGFYHEKVEWKI